LLTKRQAETYRFDKVAELEHLCRLIFISVIRVGFRSDTEKLSWLKMDDIYFFAHDARKLLAYAGNPDDNITNPFIEMRWGEGWILDVKSSYIVGGEWAEKARKFIDKILEETQEMDMQELKKKLEHDHPDIERIEVTDVPKPK
jgi:hypothetical protein